MEKSGTIMHGAEMHLNTSRRLFVPVTVVYGGTAVLSQTAGYSCAVLKDSETSSCYGNFRVPSNFINSATMSAVLAALGTGDVYGYPNASYCAEGEALDTHSEWDAYYTYPIANNLLYITAPHALDAGPLALGDFVGLSFTRKDDALDTLSAELNVLGFVVDYNADQ